LDGRRALKRGFSLEREAMTVKIVVRTDSSYKVEGEFQIVKLDGTEVPHTGQTAYLCRCGLSKNKPFCDSAHKAAGFKAE
jgi:CDGSH-type Zn-finger protein